LLEPTEDWTIEQLNQWVLNRARHKNSVKCRELVDLLSQHLVEVKRQIWDLHYEAMGAVNDENIKTESIPSSVEVNHEDLPRTHSDDVAMPTDMKNPTQLFVEVVQGPYQGATFVLRPEHRKPCFIGRSAGKKFRNNGISLANNPEVSTTHGKVEIQMMTEGGIKFYYTDTGSTNGTLYMDEELEDNVPLELFHGIELSIGGSMLRFSFLYD
jgi:hypothetical protein